MDPRLEIIDERLEKIGKLVAISGGKGGTGKSSVASLLALTLVQCGKNIGLLDLDFCGPSTHVILGIKGVYPKEEKGIIPPTVHNMKYMSIIFYSGDHPSPLRGIDLSNAIIELLAITRWGALDFLIIDMPPGIGDATLDTIRLMKRTEFFVVTTPSKLAFETVKKVLRMQKELGLPTIGVVENMKITDSSYVSQQIKVFDVPFLGSIHLDKDFENALGDVNKLSKTQFAGDIKKIVTNTPAFGTKGV